LLNDAAKVQRIYNLNFRAIPLPPAPKVTAVADGNGKIILYWTGVSESYNEFDKIDCTGYWKFQGYEVYQIKPGKSGEDPQDRTLLGVWDLNPLYNNDSIGTVWDTLEVLQPNGVVREEVLPVALGQNSGLTRHLTLTQNQYPTGVNNLFINGQDYFFAVLAYGVNLDAKKPNKVLKNPISSQTIKVTPYFPIMGSTFQFKQFDTLMTNRIDKGFMPVVLDQKKVISATYRMEFVTDTTLSPPESKTWRVLRIRNSQIDTIIWKCEDMMIGTENYIVDGIVFKVQRIQWFGVIRDPVPGYFPDLQTNAKGWTYTPSDHLNLRGVDTAESTYENYPPVFKQSMEPMQSVSMGLAWPGGRNFRAGFKSKIDSGIVENPPVAQFLETYSLKKVKITFGQTQKAYRYVGNLGATAQIHPFRDMSDVPFKVEVDDPLDTAGAPRQLNVGWVDADSNGTWNPNESPTGGTEIVYIFYSNYSETPMSPYNKDIGLLARFIQCDVMYIWWPRKINSGPAYQNGDVLTIYPYTILRKYINPGMILTYDVSTIAPDIGNVTVAKDRNELDLIRVVPNPYFGGHAQETSPFDRFVKFMRLPKTCSIYIYTLNGNLIRTLNKDDNSTTMNWDLLNMDQIPVASGIYIAYIDAPGVGTKIIKIAVFTPEERIDRF
jgi:hypothetical protein